RTSAVDHPGPSTPWALYWVARLWMWVFGWDVEGDSPRSPRAVVIAAPHTSNWDLPHMLAASLVFRVRLSWLGKHTLFKPPFGWFMRALGGLAIDRTAAHGAVQGVADLLLGRDGLYIAVPPSGTRSKRDHWKSGFYWIAHTAQVPIVCGYLDYSRKRAGLGFSLLPTGDIRSDMEKIRAFYADKRGKFPDSESTIELVEERAAAPSP
ncbi:MAG: 1-acyl-sn-glycerol-3-phosphate acyltransferase, partial [Myxococcota bacterium]